MTVIDKMLKSQTLGAVQVSRLIMAPEIRIVDQIYWAPQNSMEKPENVEISNTSD
jgi:hypothetical protein